MAQKVNKIYTCCHKDFYISKYAFNLFAMTPGSENLSNIAFYGFNTNFMIYFMV